MYNDFKKHNDQLYTGMSVGATHDWVYQDGTWSERKISPEEWLFRFSCTKGRSKAAPVGSGAALGTEYHWYIIADQRVQKLDADHYRTLMEGMKFKVGHKRPHWRSFSYEYPEQMSYRQKVISVLEDTLTRLKQEELL